jgi:hypothetical protein
MFFFKTIANFRKDNDKVFEVAGRCKLMPGTGAFHANTVHSLMPDLLFVPIF